MVNIAEAEKEMSAAYKAGDFETAYARAQAVVEADKSHVNGLRHMARIATNRRDMDAAKPVWSALTKVDPDAPEPWLQLARIAHRDGNTGTCRHYLQSLLVLQPDNVEARTMQVECLLKDKDDKHINAAFKALCQFDLRNAARLARIAVHHGMGVEIAATLQSLAEGGDQGAINLCDTLFRAERDSGIGFEIQKNPFGAAKCYHTMRILRPDSDYPTTSLTRLRRPFLERARRAYRSQEYERACEHAHSCIKIDPCESEPYIIFGRAAYANNQLDRSYAVLKKGVANCATDGWLKVNFARAAARKQIFLEAIMVYRDVLDLQDGKSISYHAQAQSEIARLQDRLPQQALRDARDENFATAFDAVVYLTRHDPANGDTQRLKANIANLAQRKLRALFDEDDNTVVKLADQLIAFDATLPYPYRVAGRITYQSGDLARSRDYWNALVQLDGESVEFWLMKARCSLGLKDAADAGLAARAILAIDQTHAETARILKSVT